MTAYAYLTTNHSQAHPWLLNLRSILCLLALVFCLATLGAQSIREQEQFTYILELYDSSGQYLQELSTEIEAFRSQYPNSTYNTQLDYLRANIALQQGNYPLCLELYPRLLDSNLHPDILGDVYLNYAIALYYTADYPLALEQLATLGKSIDQPYYNYQAHVWRGRIHAVQGHYLSAENELLLALKQDTIELRYEYFLILLKLERDEAAQALLDSLAADTPALADFHYAWLEYLLSAGDYQQFDAFLAEQYPGEAPMSADLALLRVRKALELENFSQAKSVLDNISITSDTRDYYRALLLKQQGDPGAADSLFKKLLSSPEADLSFFSYLERLKILFDRDPVSATLQLFNYIQTANPQRGEPYHQLGFFLLQQGNYAGAIHQFFLAEDYDLPAAIADRNSDLSAEAYFRLGEYPLAKDAYNSYLNQFPQGRYRDKALYHLGLIHFLEVDYRLATTYFETLMREYPQSAWVDEARFHLAEMRFFASDYTAAAALYQSIALSARNYPVVLQRLAQSYYYLERYPEALHTLGGIPDSLRNFDTTVLLAGIKFSQKDYAAALADYKQAENLAQNPPQKTEAISYEAYTLYYLKRFQEASSLFYQLSRDSLNADIYLYQAAKSAAQGKAWQRALDLYDSFLDTYPDSPYFLAVLAEIANTQYNLGNYESALQDWINLLRRFTAKTSVSSEDQALLTEVFTGIEICSRRLDDTEHISQILELIDTFQSDYIKFELEYIVVKLYANAELWAELLTEATQLRSSLNLQDKRRNDLELLMAQSLIGLDQYAQADTLLGSVYASTGSRESLLQWAELAALTGDNELALQRYLDAWKQAPDPLVWLKMLDLSVQNKYLRFPELWSLGSKYRDQQPQSRLQYLRFLFDTGDRDTALAEADSILNTEINPWLRAQTELIAGRIAFERADYASALRTFHKIRLLHQEFPDVLTTANYYYILCLINSDARQEAELALSEVRATLNAEQIATLESLLSGQR